MKYKVLPGTALFDTLMAVQKKMIKANKAADKIAKEVGAEGCANASNKIAGGILGFKFKIGGQKNSDKPGWKKLESGYTLWWFPLEKEKSNKDLLQRIYELPTIDISELNTPLNFHGGAVSHEGGIAWVKTPSVLFPDKKQAVILIGIHPGLKEYKPVDGMIDILESEYNKLKKD